MAIHPDHPRPDIRSITVPSAPPRSGGDAAIEIALIDCRPDSPCRPGDWRWRVASHLSARPRRRRPRWADSWVNRARRFLTAGADRPGRGRRRAAPRQDPEVEAALAVHAALDPVLRLEVECRVLADQPAEEIAARCGLTTGTLAAYESLFFDLRARLAHTDYVLFTAAGPGLFDGSGDIEAIVKALALFHGPHVLDAVLDGLRAVPAASPDIAWRNVLVRLALAARGLPLGTLTEAGLLRLMGFLHDHATVLAGVPVGLVDPIRPLFEAPIDAMLSTLGGTANEPGVSLLGEQFAGSFVQFDSMAPPDPRSVVVSPYLGKAACG